MIVFRLPRPPSVNNLFFTARNNRRAPTRRYQAWRAEAHRLIMVQRVGQSWPILGAYRLTATIERRKSRTMDLDNAVKAVSDALVHMGIVSDDRHAEEIVLRWGDVAGCEVRIEAAEEARDAKEDRMEPGNGGSPDRAAGRRVPAGGDRA